MASKYCQRIVFEEAGEQHESKQASFAANKNASEDTLSVPSTDLEASELVSDWDSEEEEGVCDLGEAFDSEDTLIIFDWDDTILPSHWLRAQGLELDGIRPSPEQWEMLNRLAASATETLNAACCKGTVILVTNAEHGWVELSCARYLPSLLSMLSGLRVISARSMYERHGVISPFEWKRLAFEQEIGRFCKHEEAQKQRRKNVISVGDAAYEREALISATDPMLDCCVKSVKFAESPDVLELLREHEVIGGCFNYIIQHNGNLDLCIQ
jgi:hypothetical protein